MVALADLVGLAVMVGLAGFVICTAAMMSDLASFVTGWPDSHRSVIENLFAATVCLS